MTLTPARPFLPLALVGLAALLGAPKVFTWSACPEGPVTMPLVPGTTWVYAGDVQRIVPKKGSGHLLARHVTRSMEVRAAFRRGDTTAALVKGHPAELGWYKPGRPRGTYLFFQRDDGTLSVVSEDVDASLQHRKETGEVPDESLGVAAPLRVGKTWGGDENAGSRPDKWYQWHVEGARCVALRGIGGIDRRGRRREYRLGYRTGPEHTLVYWSPGLGMTRFVYRHHGPVADADVRLVAFQPGPPDAPVERVRSPKATPGGY